MDILIGMIVLALFSMFCFQNFFIQLLAIKLLIDCLVLTLGVVRNPNQSPFNSEVFAVLLASLGVLIFFLLMTAEFPSFLSPQTSTSKKDQTRISL